MLVFFKRVYDDLQMSVSQSVRILFVYSLLTGDESSIYLFLVTGCLSVGKINDDEVFKITSCCFVPLQENSDLDARMYDVQKLLNSGCFFFSWSPKGNNTFDLSLCAQRRHLQQEPDNRFFW